MTNSTFYPFTAPRFFKLRGTCARCADAELCHSAGAEDGRPLVKPVQSWEHQLRLVVCSLITWFTGLYMVLYGFIYYPFKCRTSAISSMISIMALTWFGVQCTNSMLRKSQSWVEGSNRENRTLLSKVGSPCRAKNGISQIIKQINNLMVEFNMLLSRTQEFS